MRFLAVLLALAGPVFAQDGTVEGLVARVDAYEALMAQGQFAQALDYMPPSLMAAVAKQAGTDEAGFRRMMTEQIQQVADSVDMKSAVFDIPVEGVAVDHAEGGRAYAVLTSKSAFPALGVPEMTAPILALVEGDDWYLVRIESPMHKMMLSQVFPDLAGPVSGLGAPQ